MNKPTSNLINIVATGFIVLVLLSLLLFWGRFLCVVRLISNRPSGSSQIIIRPSGLVPGEPAPKRAVEEPVVRYEARTPSQNEPNFRYSSIYTSIDTVLVFSRAIGAFWDIAAEIVPYYDVNERVYYWYDEGNGRYFCFDKPSGLIIRNYKSSEPNDKSMSSKTEFFAGPNGISEKADSSLGRFYDPIVTEGWATIGLYDKKTRCFYLIDFAGGSVSKGLQLAEGDRREPIAIVGIRNELPIVSGIGGSSPQIWNAEKDVWEQQEMFLPGGDKSSHGYDFVDWDWTYTYIPVLDKTGQIYIYNTSEQSLTQAGYLPMPQSLLMGEQRNDIARPKDVLAYWIQPFYAVLRSPREGKKVGRIIDTKYLGMGVACASREGMTMAIDVFDPNEKMIYRGDTTMYSSGSTLATIDLFFLENLQPPVFEIASYLCGNRIEASAGHRALFVLPNSFVGMLGRYNGPKFDREVFLPLLMGPSLILSIWLAFRVRKDAKILGLSGTAKKWWTVGTIAFGLPAYITYRLTRPKETLVTCQNCGMMRRPDTEICHRCGSKWEVPELTPPNWRICD
ncbi:MAG: hypothetical protein WBL85_07815 [Sedimentisphaerales bacterium]